MLNKKEGVTESHRPKQGAKYTLASLGVVTILSLGGYGYHSLGADADELEVTYIESDEDGESVEVDGTIPVIQYMVVGGEPRDIEYDRSDTEDTINYYVNNSDDELEIKEIEDVTNSNLDVVYSEFGDDLKVNSVVDFGNIGVQGNLTQTTEDFINLSIEGDVTEYIAEYNSETGTYELVGERDSEVSSDDIRDNDYALITFVDKFEPIEEPEESESEDESESDSTESETDDSVEDVEGESEEEGDSEEEETDSEDESEETESDEEGESEENESNEETESEESEETEEPVEDGETESEDEEEETESESEESTEIDVSNAGGTETLLGDPLTIGESENNPNDDGLTLFVTPDQLDYLTGFVDTSYEDHEFYTSNEITSAQDLYDKFGLYNISEEIEWLYVSELDENGDGVLGNVPERQIVNWVELDESHQGDLGDLGPDGEGGLEEGADTIEDIKDEAGDYDPDELGHDVPEDPQLDESSDEVVDRDEIENTEESVQEGEDVNVDDIPDVEYGEVIVEDFDGDGEQIENPDYDIEDSGSGSTDTESGSSSEQPESSDTTPAISEIDINLDNTTDRESGVDIRFSDDGRISEVFNEDGVRIAYRDANGELVYTLSATHPDRVAFESQLSSGELTVEDSSGNTAKVSESGEILPDTGVADNSIIPIAVGAIVMGLGIFGVTRLRKPKTDDKD